MLDKQMKPHLLEINSNPSLNIEFDPGNCQKSARKVSICQITGRNKDGFLTHRGSLGNPCDTETVRRKEISPIDLHVKKRAVGDIIRMLNKYDVEKLACSDFKGYRSYEKIFDPEIEVREFPHVTEFDKILEMYHGLCGIRVQPNLSLAKFSKTIRWFNRLGMKKLEVTDAECTYKNMLRDRGGMDFGGFVDGLYDLINKAYGSVDNRVVKNRIYDVFQKYEWCQRTNKA